MRARAINKFFADVCTKFNELCEGARNVIYERLVCKQRNQKEGERADNSVSELKRLSLTCEFGDLKKLINQGSYCWWSVIR